MGSGKVLNWSGLITSTVWPMAFSSATTRVRVRTTPLTCGSQASVATRMRSGRWVSRVAVIASRMRGSERADLARSGGATAWVCIQAQKAPSNDSLVGK